jgi:hypothetical protein
MLMMLALFVFVRVCRRRVRMFVCMFRFDDDGVRVFVLRVIVRMLVRMRYFFVRVFVLMFMFFHCRYSFW